MGQDVGQLVEAVAARAGAIGAVLTCAESCTGGWIAKVITDLPGSSNWFDRGFVTYSNQAKQDMLGVLGETLQQYGAVSQQTVLQMASGALRHSMASHSVAVSGIAGPGGGSADKPVGSVWVGWAGPSTVDACLYRFDGDREAVRLATVRAALQGLLERL